MSSIVSPPKYLAVTGRVADWIDSAESRYPVSCTTFSVEDSMEGKNGIEDSWLFTSFGIRHAAGVALDLSKLRPGGHDNGKGLISSGASSFAKFYSLINQELRRGGLFRNGAVTLFLDHDHPDILDFIALSPADLPWAKKAVYLDHNIHTSPHLSLIARSADQGKIWLAKKQWNRYGTRLYSNVCLEILLEHRGTCLLSHVNLGLIGNIKDIPSAMAESMDWLCNLHKHTNVTGSGHYLPSYIDRQVGLGVIGLANLLAIQGVTYAEFTRELDQIVMRGAILDKEKSIAQNIYDGYYAAARVAREHRMERAFTIAPTASCSYRAFDAHGFTIAPEISPPIARQVDRDSETLGVKTYEYHPRTEIAVDVGWSTQWKLLNLWQRMMDATELAHTISANIWTSQKIDEKWILEEFMPSALQTTYYRISVDNYALDKSEILTPTSAEEKLRSIYADPLAGAASDPQYCAACGD
jgi:Ribonucleotide reductase, barrel domain